MEKVSFKVDQLSWFNKIRRSHLYQAMMLILITADLNMYKYGQRRIS